MKSVNTPCLISIVVPIYNVENYLLHCVSSLLNQTFDNYEIILVDDCSPDHSGLIADELAIRYKNVRVIHRETNGGLGPARNTGLEASLGQYVMFVDSDDWIDNDTLLTMYIASVMYDLDVCFTGRKVVINDLPVSTHTHPYAGKILEGSDVVRFIQEFFGPLPIKIKDSDVPVSAWAALYRREYLISNDFKFVNSRSEDILFNIPVCLNSKKIGFTYGTHYNYRCDNADSITKTVSEQSINSYLDFFEKFYLLAITQDSSIRDESVLRAKRRILDFSRGAICLILSSSLNYDKKKELVDIIFTNCLVQKILSSYPIWKTPLPQACFSFALKHKSMSLCRLLNYIRGKFD